MKKIVIIAVALLALALLSGCDKSSQVQNRYLNQGEAEQLLAMQSIRESDEMIEDSDDPGGDLRARQNDPAYLEKTGDALVAMGKLPNAIVQYKRAELLVPEEKKAGLRKKIAAVHLRAGAFPQAADYYLRLTQAEPDNAQLWEGLGLAMMGIRQADKAKEALDKSLELRPDSWRSLNAMGILYDRVGRPAEAAEYFLRALAVRKDLPFLYNNLAMAYLAQGKLAEARVQLERALFMQPDYVTASNNLAVVMVRQGQAERALQLFQRTLGKAESYNNVGVILAWLGKKEEAAWYFEQALAIKPNYYEKAGRHLARLKLRSKPQAGAASGFSPINVSPVSVDKPRYGAGADAEIIKNGIAKPAPGDEAPKAEAAEPEAVEPFAPEVMVSEREPAPSFSQDIADTVGYVGKVDGNGVVRGSIPGFELPESSGDSQNGTRKGVVIEVDEELLILK